MGNINNTYDRYDSLTVGYPENSFILPLHDSAMQLLKGINCWKQNSNLWYDM